MGLRTLTLAGRLGFLLALVPDTILLVLFLLTFQDEDDQSSPLDLFATFRVPQACALVWLLRSFAWLLTHVVLGVSASMRTFALLSVPMIVLAHLLTPVSVYAFLGAYASLVLHFVFFFLYPTDWAMPRPQDVAAFRATVQPADLRTCGVFALGGDADVYTNKLVAPGGPHAAEAFWLQEIGDPSHPVVVLFAGMPSSSVGMASVITGLQLLGYFVVLIDYPGVGNGRGQRFTVAEVRRRTQLYLTELQPRPGTPARLHGVSGGGNMVLWLAAELPNLVSAVAAVVGVAPGSPFSFHPNRSVFWHGLTLKTKSDQRFTPRSAIFKVVRGTLTGLANGLTVVDATWHENLRVADAAVADPATCSAQDYFHDPELLKREFFAPTGPGSQDGYADKMAAVKQRVLAWVQQGAYKRAMFCPEIYPEYVQEYCKCDMDGALACIKCPVVFFGGTGDVASGHYDSWKAALPRDTPSEVVMAQIVNPGVGGINAHSHAGTFWRRHTLTLNRFFRSTMNEV